MHNTWTPAAIRAIEAVRRIADQPEKNTSVHLLRVLIEEEEGRPAQLLNAAGLPWEVAQRAVEGMASVESAGVQMDPLMDAARGLAQSMSGDRTIGSEHLLLAVLHLEPDLRHVLVESGLDFVRLSTAPGQGQSTVIPLDEPLDLGEPRESIDVARILDVNFNRAREALRVAEDYCRFRLNDAFLCRELKTLRHELTDAVRGTGAPLVAGRDTQHDVGTQISTAAEQWRASLSDVAAVNFKRLQEALRSLEEHAKLIRPEFGAIFEKLRYRSYTLERAVVSGTSARQQLQDARLYAIVTGSACAAALEFVIAEAAAGGVDIIQLREKSLTDRELLERARRVRRWTRDAGVLFIVNDRPDIARAVEADGVHIGQDDMPVHEARRIVGSNVLIGVSTHHLEQVRQAVLDGADYIGVGPIFPSATKEFAEFPGLQFLRSVSSETTLPAFALGGITLANVDEVISAGGTRIAVSSAICRADEPQPAARALRLRLPGRAD